MADVSFQNICKDCGEIFCMDKFLTKHMKRNHRKFACEDCEK